ncbi:MAG: N-acetyltransferase [Rhodospirillales bacterium]
MRDYQILPETPDQGAKIEILLDRTFGPSRTDRTVYRLREGHPPLPDLCFVAVGEDGDFFASLRFWPILIEADPAILLGPLTVEPALQGRGIGKALVRHGLTAAKRLGHRLCIVVGEPSYYGPYGFRSAPEVGLILPGPVDPRRFQVLELVPDALQGIKGRIQRDERARSRRPSPEALWAASLLSRSG